MRRRILVLWSAAGLVAGAIFWFWPLPLPHLLLITLDTTRADRLGCYDYRAGQTPVLDALAAGGVLCERAFTVAPITLPSHTSMFTGFHPAEHGVVTNGRGRLDDGIPTLAEVLKRAGYDTGAFVASFVLNGKFGLERGFRTYDDDFASAEAAPDALHRQRHGEAVVDAALQWLGVKRGKPFFCWVHLYDPHAPYLPHAELFGDKFVDRPYDAEIAYVDRQIGRLVDFLKSRGLERQTLVVVVGDHGEGLAGHAEGLAEHLERQHGSTLYNETLRVPLIFRHVGRLPAKQRVTGNISLVDLSPTILDILGLKDPRRITGQSLKKTLSGGELPPRLVYGATDDPFLVSGWSPLRCLIEGQWKYIRTTKPELYNLGADPDERTNLLEAEPVTARMMKSRMSEFESRLAPRAAIAVHLTAQERRALEGLGYLGGGNKIVPSGPAPADLPDIKDMLRFDIAVEDAMDLAAGGSINEAIEQLREIVRKAPRHAQAYWYLASALRDASQLGESEKVLRSLLEVKPDCSYGHFSLGTVLMHQGKSAEAMAEFQKTIDIDPDNTEAHCNMARLLATAGQHDNALAHCNAALEIDHQDITAYQWRANVLARLGQTAAAVADFRMALKYAPDTVEAHHNLGVVLIEAGEAEEGGRHLARAVELSPNNPQLQFALGDFFASEQQYDNALRHLAKALELEPGFHAAQERMRQVSEVLQQGNPRSK